MSNSSKTKNDYAWEDLFEEHAILDEVNRNGQFIVSSRDINKYREARLMTKFDHRANLPRLFRDNQLSILPLTRGTYVIARFDAYESIDDTGTSIRHLTFPDHIQSIDYENITGEASAINCAYVSGILADFLEDTELLPTVGGRMSSGSFRFGINSAVGQNSLWFDISNSQIEIDGGFEGINSLSLIEAKNSIASDFLIRQLYYPFRLWKDKVTKTVIPIFMVYSNGIFQLNQYDFEDPLHYNSIVLVKRQYYSLEQRNITLDDIHRLLAHVSIVAEPEIPFPQADSFVRVINLCELLFESEELSREEVTTTYDFDVRQTNYYTDAGRYLGLIDKKTEDGVKYFLTDKGRGLFGKSFKERQLGFAEAILSHAVFGEALRLYLQIAELPDINAIVNIMEKSDLYNVKAQSTYRRRASTVQSWINWILALQE